MSIEVVINSDTLIEGQQPVVLTQPQAIKGLGLSPRHFSQRLTLLMPTRGITTSQPAHSPTPECVSWWGWRWMGQSKWSDAPGGHQAQGVLQKVSGREGIGKTQTAVEYAYRYREHYTAVFWTRAGSRDLLISDFLTIAALLNLPQRNDQEREAIVRAVLHWLDTHESW